ncbi:tyrosine-type recombinase/integrase [Mucilaginibacter sp. KACC 22063]|uniref:tyrosine-type recombinase/integrase n=1 Tax=Mucilaginibacter sp. KACC 22063 TaxID=3025666 RepID=UPI002365CECE|nr:site-specific integrase [Mucilaginibacter sp. KACC 22063]WDF55258.1 site-specific integrase [Mucilaginibacter sp. KACC 22063]
MRLTYNIKAVLRPDKKRCDGLVPIYHSIRVGPATNRVPTGKYISEKDWDKSTSLPKKNTKLNQLLSKCLTDKMDKWWTEMLQMESLGKTVTLTSACAFFQENAKVTFYSFFQEQIDLWSESKAENTLKSYRSTLNVLKEFAPKADFGDLSYEFVQKFDLYMGKKRGNGTGGKFGRHKNLKSIINEAIKKGYYPMDQHPYRYFKVKSAVGKRQFLSVKEVNQLMAFQVPEKASYLNKVKDLFLFGCFTGLRYCDVMSLTWNNIDYSTNTITVEMTKVKKQVTIPLMYVTKDIIEKYGKHTIKSKTTLVLPQITNQALNRDLKVLMEKAGINKPISSHSSRHTFASNLIEAKTNILYVKDLLGHSKITETQIYAKSLQADLHGSMENLAAMYNKAI